MATRTRRTTLDPQVETVLRAAEVTHHAEIMAAARTYELAATWAELHPGDDVDPVVDDDGNLVMYGDQPLSLAGEGAPTVAEFAIPEFAAAVGLSPVAGRKLVGSALEAKHRLPRLWARVMTGEVPAWKVRRITEHTHRLPAGGAQYVDAALAPIAHDCSFAQIESTAMTAVEQYDHERFEELRRRRAKHRHLDIALGDAALNDGLVPVTGLLDLADARALEAAVKTKAHALLTEHPELDLDTRRAMALGHLADTSLAGGGSGARELVIYAHHDSRQTHGVVNVEGGSSPITIDQLAEWCRQANTRVSIRPVLDLSEHLSTDAYAPGSRLREQIVLTCPTCVFPGCGRSARRCDLDHITPWHRGGATTSRNLAPLCRLHHRLKTHGFWTYRRLTMTSFEWTSPMGRVYLSDLTHKRRRTH
ncbi:HNH endonuclease signature motif containing protein [Nocardioides conyzicola]|uniref:HNH nuclease domain-containing protein n=1 Tax=Nocardioides conyzicola TaxID=1651781 RepID=A0ABP8XHE0_9ACTN